MSKKPINEGKTRGNIKGGVQKPTTSTIEKPKAPPPAPKPKKKPKE